jgi:hypothetical protein
VNVRNRQRLLAVARWLDRCAMRIRAHVKATTPKRRRLEQASG